jgi:hypothetical protein
MINIKEIEEMLKTDSLDLIDTKFHNLCEDEKNKEYARYAYIIIKGIERAKLTMIKSN